MRDSRKSSVSRKDGMKLTALVRQCKHASLEPSNSLIMRLIESSSWLIGVMVNAFACKGAVAGRTQRALTNARVTRLLFSQVPRDVRHMLAIEALYFTIISFFSSREPLNVWRYLSKYAPRVYSRLIATEIPEQAERWGIFYAPSWAHVYHEDEEKLPGSPEEYLHFVERIGVGTLSQLYPSLKREHLYYLIKQVAKGLTRV